MANGRLIIVLALVGVLIISNFFIMMQVVRSTQPKAVHAPNLIRERLHQMCLADHDRFEHEVKRLQDRNMLVIEYKNCQVDVIFYVR